MSEPTLEQLHWNQLRKQFLLDEKITSYFEVAKYQLGLHSTDYWTPYFSTWARIGDFDAKDMFESLDNGRKLVRTHAFRTTIHVMHIDNLSMIISATGPSLFKAYRTDKYRKVDILTDQEIEAILSGVKVALMEGPLRTTDLKKIVPGAGDHIRSALLMLMARGEVVRAKAKQEQRIERTRQFELFDDSSRPLHNNDIDLSEVKDYWLAKLAYTPERFGLEKLADMLEETDWFISHLQAAFKALQADGKVRNLDAARTRPRNVVHFDANNHAGERLVKVRS